MTREHVEDDGPEHMYKVILLSSGIAFALIAAVLIWRFAIQELRKEIEMDSAETWFRYKRHSSSTTATASSTSSAFAKQPSAGSVPELRVVAHGEEGQEMALQQGPAEEASTYGILVLLGLEVAHGLEGHFEGPEDSRDEEWFWLWT